MMWRQNGGIDTRQRNEFGQQFFSARHASAAYQANIPSFITTTGLFRANNRAFNENFLARHEHIGVLSDYIIAQSEDKDLTNDYFIVLL
jgi:hypothetical protein